MSKTPLPQAFQLANIGGFRYTRGVNDATPPTTPTLFAPVASSPTTLSVNWVYGVDAQSGIGAAYVEWSPSGQNQWTRIIVAYPNTQTTISGLASSSPYDIRIANIDLASPANLSAYSPIRTVTTLGSSADLAPGTVALTASQFSVRENTIFTASINRTGGGISSPAIEVDWAFTGFAAGTPSPGNGTLSWAPGENGPKTLQATSGSVSANQTGTLSIVAVRSMSGNIAPTIGSPSQTAVTVQNIPSTGKKWNPGFYMSSNAPTYPSDVKLQQQITEQNYVLAAGPKCLGWRGIYKTAVFMTGLGTWDFSRLFRDLNRLRSMTPAKRLIIYITCQDYGSTQYTDVTPAYIYNNSAYGPSPIAGKYGWWYITTTGQGAAMAFWRPAVMDQIIAMWQALAVTPNPATGLTIDDDPYVEFLIFNETATPPYSGSAAGADPTYTSSSILVQYKRLIDAIVAAYPKTVFMVQNNYTGSKANTQDLTNYTLAKGCAQGGPDTWYGDQINSPQYLTWGQAAALGVAQGDPAFTGPDLRGTIGMMSVTEGTETTYRSPYTPITYFNQINNVLRQSHCILNGINFNATDDPIPPYPQEGKNTSANPGNWHQMLQVINGQNLTHIQKPTGIA